MTLNQTEKMN